MSYVVIILALMCTLFHFWSAFVLSIKYPIDFFTPSRCPSCIFGPPPTAVDTSFVPLMTVAGLAHGQVNNLIVATLTLPLSLLILYSTLTELLDTELLDAD